MMRRGSRRPEISGPVPRHGACARLKINLAVIILSHIIHHVTANSLLSFDLKSLMSRADHRQSPPPLSNAPPSLVQTVGMHKCAVSPRPPLLSLIYYILDIKHHAWPYGARAKKPLSVSERVSHSILYTLLGFVLQCGVVQCVFSLIKPSRVFSPKVHLG